MKNRWTCIFNCSTKQRDNAWYCTKLLLTKQLLSYKFIFEYVIVYLGFSTSFASINSLWPKLRLNGEIFVHIFSHISRTLFSTRNVRILVIEQKVVSLNSRVWRWERDRDREKRYLELAIEKYKSKKKNKMFRWKEFGQSLWGYGQF